MIQSFLRHALRDGFFHADMHPGNLFVDDDGRLVAVDFGIMGRLGVKERRFLAEILLGFITRDYRRVAEVHFEAGYVPPHHSVENFAQAIRAIGEPIHNRTAEEISMAKTADAAARGHRPVRHAHPARTDPAAKDHGGGRRRRAQLRSQARHVEDRRTGGARMDRRAISARPASWKTPREGTRALGRLHRQRAGPADARRAVLEQIGAMTREGFTLSPETIAAMDRAEAGREPLDHRRRCGSSRPDFSVDPSRAMLIAMIAVQS